MTTGLIGSGFRTGANAIIDLIEILTSRLTDKDIDYTLTNTSIQRSAGG